MLTVAEAREIESSRAVFADRKVARAYLELVLDRIVTDAEMLLMMGRGERRRLES